MSAHDRCSRCNAVLDFGACMCPDGKPTFPLSPTPARDAVEDLARQAKAKYDAMSPVERALHDVAQKRSFVTSGVIGGPDIFDRLPEAALAAIKAAGFAVAPREPTAGMCAVGLAQKYTPENSPRNIWSAMIAAAEGEKP